MCQIRRILAIVCDFAKQSHECDLAVARKRTRKNREIETTRRVTLCLVLRVQFSADAQNFPHIRWR